MDTIAVGTFPIGISVTPDGSNVYVANKEVNALVDLGAYMLCINEQICKQLGLRIILKQTAQLANGEIMEVDIVGSIEVTFLNRSTSCRAMVLPGNNEVLLGAIPLEDMDLIIDPRDQQLKLPADRPYLAQKSLKYNYKNSQALLYAFTLSA